MNFSITQFGRKLNKSLYTWDEQTKTFSTKQDNLVLDFSNIDGLTFKTIYGCTFKTGSYCTFNTGSYCTFETGYSCTFDTGYSCIFKTGSECVVVRRDIFEVIQLEASKKIKLNNFKIKGFEYISDSKTIIIDGKEIEISNESFENLKKQLK